MNVRALAADIITKVIVDKQSLANFFHSENDIEAQNQRLLKELVYGVIRWYFRLDWIAAHLLNKPLRTKDQDVYTLILLGLYQLIFMRIPPHAAVFETVQLAKSIKKIWAKSLINAVLQKFLRIKDDLPFETTTNPVANYSHPEWLIDELRGVWPNLWEEILTANNTKAPIWLRVNAQKISTNEYQKLLNGVSINSKLVTDLPSAILLQEAARVEDLPLFADGYVSIQDGAAQLAAELLYLEPNLTVLDACAAPGGKTCHILEKQPFLRKVVAVEKDSQRVSKIHDNLTRLGLKAEVVSSEVENLDQWWDGTLFDRILLDTPCSATGVIRRHPDIKLLRTNDDIGKLVDRQKALLQTMWPLLKPGGILLYATCSILPRENVEVAKSLVNKYSDCVELPIITRCGHPQEYGIQILPGEHEMDGFYYARFQKNNIKLSVL